MKWQKVRKILSSNWSDIYGRLGETQQNNFVKFQKNVKYYYNNEKLDIPIVMTATLNLSACFRTSGVTPG